MLIHTAGTSSTLDLKGAWSTFWQKVSGSYEGSAVETTVTIVGVALIAWSILKFFWDKRRGGGARQSPIWWTLALGGLMIGPNFLIPAILTALQLVINAAVKLLQSISGTSA
ncbi:hypothetical protein [Leifsonia sp. Leaf264]|uniref:hypothetical protein n=1 Tax=Leifsonia sp. Leaf264 TaxID=1736314 RepID=UPI0006F353EC|nr:hypothetical protein [Leifsonia sp. Leaf264]KQO98842.1 hypothetical protein ASF30_12325 [Leifsonia sp. Leaf264]